MYIFELQIFFFNLVWLMFGVITSTLEQWCLVGDHRPAPALAPRSGRRRWSPAAGLSVSADLCSWRYTTNNIFNYVRHKNHLIDVPIVWEAPCSKEYWSSSFQFFSLFIWRFLLRVKYLNVTRTWLWNKIWILEIDLLQAISIPFDDPKHVYFAEGLHGFPAFGLRAGSDLRTPHSLLLPVKMFDNFAILASIKPSDQQGGFLFSVVTPSDSIISLGLSITGAQTLGTQARYLSHFNQPLQCWDQKPKYLIFY